MVERSAEGTTFAEALGLGPVDQLSFAVRDVEASIPAFRALFGEFRIVDFHLDPEYSHYRGKPTDARIRAGFGGSDDFEIELIQVVSGGAPQIEHLARHGEGLHHVRIRVEDLCAALERVKAAGCEVVFGGRSANGMAWVYVEAPASYGHALFELAEYPPGDPRRPKRSADPSS